MRRLSNGWSVRNMKFIDGKKEIQTDVRMKSGDTNYLRLIPYQYPGRKKCRAQRYNQRIPGKRNLYAHPGFSKTSGYIKQEGQWIAHRGCTGRFQPGIPACSRKAPGIFFRNAEQLFHTYCTETAKHHGFLESKYRRM